MQHCHRYSMLCRHGADIFLNFTGNIDFSNVSAWYWNCHVVVQMKLENAACHCTAAALSAEDACATLCAANVWLGMQHR
jgi:hypothetical protein